MMMVNGCEQMADIHDRMPTILRQEDWAQWTDGTPNEAIQLCQVYPDLLRIERTSEPWFKPGS